jgi:hypothetical protein
MHSISAETAANDRFLIEGPGPKAWIHNYIHHARTHDDGTPRTAGEPLPMIYLVDQEPNSAIQTHFHQVDQFQIVIGGSGAMGREPLGPITVHYTSAYTGYGPLASGPDGLQYLTIRNLWDPGLRPLPEARAELPPAGTVKQRQRTTAPLAALSEEALAALDGPMLRQLMEEPDSGSAAWVVAIPPGGSLASPAKTGADRVLVVCSGSLSGTQADGLHSCHFVPAGELLTLQAGTTGADILILQFREKAIA